MSNVVQVKSGYMNRAHDPKAVVKAARLLLQHHPDKLRFDTLVGTGLSGALVLPPLARALRKRYLVVRKSNDSSHACYPAEGELGRRWLFVDDFIATGTTLDRVVTGVSKLTSQYFHGHKTELVGVFTYGDSDGGNAQLETARAIEGFAVQRDKPTRERNIREQMCTGCEWGCEGRNCRGPLPRCCYSWDCDCNRLFTDHPSAPGSARSELRPSLIAA